MQLATERLLLRQWQPTDLNLFTEMNSDPEVMRFFPVIPSPSESEAFFQRIETHWREHGFGLFCAELVGVSPCIGFIGLSVPRFHAHFMPAVEIGWRLRKEFWNQGLATEGAKAVMNWAFTGIGLTELVSFTSDSNLPSRRVMEKIGLTHNPAEDFDHPLLAVESPLRRHVLYRGAK